MKINYKILSVNHNEHSMEVRYFTDLLTEEKLAIDSNRNPDGTPVRCRTDYNLTIWHIPCTIDDVIEQIKSSAPADWLKTKEHAETNENALAHLEHLIGQADSFEHIKQEPVIEEPLLSMADIEELLKKL